MVVLADGNIPWVGCSRTHYDGSQSNGNDPICFKFFITEAKLLNWKVSGMPTLIALCKMVEMPFGGYVGQQVGSDLDTKAGHKMAGLCWTRYSSFRSLKACDP